MQFVMKYLSSAAVAASLFFAACGGTANVANNAANTASGATNAVTATPANTPQTLVKVDRPQRVAALSSERGEQDKAAPTLKIVQPAGNAQLASSTVKVKLALSGDLKGYKPMMDESTRMGNHIHVILDNQPYEAYYNLDQEFELRNVADGTHTLRVFPSRPWHESYKSEGAFQMVKFTVKNGGAAANQPATTNSGQQMSNGAAKPTPEGKDMSESKAGEVDKGRPLLTYSRPKGEYKGADAAEIMIDFWLSNAKLVGDGGQYRVSMTVDGAAPQFIDKWEPVWFAGWAAGKHQVKLELVDKDGKLVDNGGYNSTTREITVTN